MSTSKLISIGSEYTGTSITTSVANASWTNINSVTLPAGRYLVKGAVAGPSTINDASVSFETGLYYSGSYADGSIIRGTFIANGGLVTCRLFVFSEATTVYLRCYHDYGSNVTVSHNLKAYYLGV